MLRETPTSSASWPWDILFSARASLRRFFEDQLFIHGAASLQDGIEVSGAGERAGKQTQKGDNELGALFENAVVPEQVKPVVGAEQSQDGAVVLRLQRLNSKSTHIIRFMPATPYRWPLLKA